MQDKYARIQRFFTACDELISGKYILADNKISELLKSIAASNELTTLFSAVTKGFDYHAAKQRYLKYPLTPNGTRGAAYLPGIGRRALRSYSAFWSNLTAVRCISTSFCANIFMKTEAIRRAIRSSQPA